MKKIILITALTFLVGCTRYERKCALVCTYESEYTTFVYCDSFQMHTLNKADAWIDGRKMKVEAELIRPSCTSLK